jgi:hypothetical protein
MPSEGRPEPRTRFPSLTSHQMEAAFSSVEFALASTALLAYPMPGVEICLMVDASSNHLGAALQKQPSPFSNWHLQGFFSSKKLNLTHQRAATCPTFQSIPATSYTFRERTLWWLTPCLGRQLPNSEPNRPATTPPDQIAASPPDQPAPTLPDLLAVLGRRRPWQT